MWLKRPGDTFPGDPEIKAYPGAKGSVEEKPYVRVVLPWKSHQVPSTAVFARTLYLYWDEGSGVPRNDLPRVFDVHFENVDIHETHDTGGDGEYRLFIEAGGHWYFWNEFIDVDNILTKGIGDVGTRAYPIDQTVRLYVPRDKTFRVYAGGWEADGIDLIFGKIISQYHPRDEALKEWIPNNFLNGEVHRNGSEDDPIGDVNNNKVYTFVGRTGLLIDAKGNDGIGPHDEPSEGTHEDSVGPWQSTDPSGSYNLRYTIEEVPWPFPVAEANGPYSVTEGGSIALSSVGSSAPDGSIAAFEWDFNYNGATFDVDASGPSPTFNARTLDGPSTRTIALRVRDNHDVTGIDTAKLTITDKPPTATFSNNGPVDEGSPGLVRFTDPLDPSPADTAAGFRYSYDFDNDGTFEIIDSPSASAVVPASYLIDGPSVRTVRARISDKDEGSTEYTTTITIKNVAPTATFSNNGAVNEGSSGTVSFSGQFDPSTADNAAGFRYSYDFDNDGTFEIIDSPSASAVVPASYLDRRPGHPYHPRPHQGQGW